MKIHGSATNINNCTSILRPAGLVDDGKSKVSIEISSDAAPQPHLGDPITLSNTKVTVKVPPDLLILGYNYGILKNGQHIASTLSLQIAGSNTTEHFFTYPLINASPKLVIHDPDGVPGTKDETADPLTLTISLPSTVWHPADASKNVFFTQKAAVIKASIFIGDEATPHVSTQTCATAHPSAFVAVGAKSAVATTTTVAAEGTVAPTTVAAAAAPASTLPRTGLNIAFWLIIAAVFIDTGIVALMSTRRTVRQWAHRQR